MGWHEGQRAIAAIAAEQWGLFTAHQAIDAGVSRMQLSRLTQAQLIERLSQGVYRVAGAPEPAHQEVLVAWLALRQPAESRTSLVVGGVAASQLHGIGQFWMHEVDLLVPARRRSRRSGVRIRTAQLSDRDIVTALGVPTLTPARTIADLLALGQSPDTVAGAAFDALELGITTIDALDEALVAESDSTTTREMFTGALGQRMAAARSPLLSPGE